MTQELGSYAELSHEKLADITQHEIHALATRFNLADAHTHQRQSQTQRNIVENLPRLWYDAEQTPQATCEAEFLRAFFRLQRQPKIDLNRAVLSYAASISTLVVATFLQHRHHSVTLIEPCFDNLHDILRNSGVELDALPEFALTDVSSIYDELRKRVRTSALMLVDPNNPTGFTLLRNGSRGFEEVVRFCKDHGVLLVLDLSFASFARMDPEVGRFDLYELLDSSGVSYLVIEDTGKTWPIQDAKCAVLIASSDIFRDVYNIHTSVLLNVSPFVLKMVTEYVNDSERDDFASVRTVLGENRRFAVTTLQDSILQWQPPMVGVSVAWFRIAHPRITSPVLQSRLRAAQTYVLPGTYFYWRNRAVGLQYVRVALARDPKHFRASVTALRTGLDQLASEWQE